METSEAISARFMRDLDVALIKTEAWSPAEQDRETFLANQLARLRAAAVPPYPITVSPDATARRFGEWPERYALGSQITGQLVSLAGFASDDPLAEWLG